MQKLIILYLVLELGTHKSINGINLIVRYNRVFENYILTLQGIL